MTANQAQIPSGSPVAEPMYLVDASGNPYTASGGGGGGGVVNIADPNTPANKAAVDGTGALKVSATFSASSVGINDGSNSSLKATVGPFHSSDNQGTSGIANALFSAGIAQILNPAGTIDRQRGTGIDGIPAVGVATGTQQLAGPQLSTTFNGAVTGNATAQNVVVASSANVKVGDIITTSDNVESVEIISIPDGTHVRGIFQNNHGNGATLTWFHYNQARDASVGDNVAGSGLSPSATFLYNNISGNFEYDRSANGEKDGASGFGTAVAAEYEWNGGGPYNGTAPSALQFDRARNLQGKGLGSGSIANNPLAAGSSTFTLNAAPTTLQPGQQILIDRAGANPEVGYVGTSYTAGSTSVPLQSVTAFSHAQNATVEWDQFSALGPGLSGFTAAGVGIEEEALYNPADGKFYVERSATSDGMAAANVVAESPALWNGTTFDRWQGKSGAGFIARSASTLYSTAQNAVGSGNSGDITVSQYTEIGIDITTTAQAGTSPTIQFFWDRKGADGNYYPLWQSAVYTTASNVLSTSIGAGMAYNQSLGLTGRLRWVVGGSASPSYTFTPNVYGK